MKSKTLSLLIATLCLLTFISLSAFARVADDGKSAVGTWRLDLGRSSFGSMPAPKFEQLVVNTDDADHLKWNVKGILPDGKSYIESYDGPIDGKEHEIRALVANGSATAAYTRMPSGGVQWVIKDAKGSVVETGTGQLSPDGKTLTLRGTMTGSQGTTNFVAVYNRAQ